MRGANGRPRLLYVEDEDAIAEVAKEVLGEYYRVDHAATGEAALELALAIEGRAGPGEPAPLDRRELERMQRGAGDGR